MERRGKLLAADPACGRAVGRCGLYASDRGSAVYQPDPCVHASELESVFAAIFGAILIPSQALQGRELFGCALMFAAIVLAQLPQKDTAKAAETEQSTHR